MAAVTLRQASSCLYLPPLASACLYMYTHIHAMGCYLQVFAFSAENWHREEAEVSFLLALIERVLQRELPALVGQGVRMRFIGEVGLLPRSLQAACRAAELATGDNCDV